MLTISFAWLQGTHDPIFKGRMVLIIHNKQYENSYLNNHKISIYQRHPVRSRGELKFSLQE
jgi:hypothetical protein